jgi:hypothetical protein
LDTCVWTATSENDLGRYLRAKEIKLVAGYLLLVLVLVAGGEKLVLDCSSPGNLYQNSSKLVAGYLVLVLVLVAGGEALLLGCASTSN